MTNKTTWEERTNALHAILNDLVLHKATRRKALEALLKEIEAAKQEGAREFADKILKNLPYRGWNIEGVAEADSYDKGIDDARDAVAYCLKQYQEGKDE